MECAKLRRFSFYLLRIVLVSKLPYVYSENTCKIRVIVKWLNCSST